MTHPVSTETHGAVLVVTLDRPKANAIDAATSREMGKVFQGFRDNEDLRVAIITGAGERFFCAGWPIAPTPPSRAAMRSSNTALVVSVVCRSCLI